MKFSVSICVYSGDDPVHFKDALNSVYNQTLTPSEVVLVVDGPIGEDLNGVIEEFSMKSDFRVLRLAENRGHGEARRLSVADCKYPLVAIMDADDIAEPTRFEQTIREFHADDTLDVCGGQIEEFNGDITNIVGQRRVPEDDKDIKEYLKSRCPFNQQTVIFKKDAYDKAGGYLDWYQEEDYYLWARMMLSGAKFKNLPTTLTKVRVNKDTYKRRGGFKYYRSEKQFQKYLLKNGIITRFRYLRNVIKRFIIQILMPSSVRNWAFRKFAREKINEKI